MQSEKNQGNKIRPLVLNMGSKMSNFGLTQGQAGFEGVGGTPQPKLPLSAPTGFH